MSLSLSIILTSHIKIILNKIYHFFPKLFFIFGSLLLTLVLIDFGLRKFNYPYLGCEHKGQVLETYFGSFDPETGWSYNPSTSYYGVYNGIEHHFDSRGNRVKSANLKQDSEKHKIVFIGDSVTFGTGLSYEDSFASQIENLLRQDHGLEIETINLGVQGYGTDQSLIKLKQQIEEIQPLIVVYTFIPDHLYLRNLNYNRRLHFKCLEFEGTKPLYKYDNGQIFLEKLPQKYEDYDKFPAISLIKDATTLMWERSVSKTDYAFDLTNGLIDEIELVSAASSATNYYIFYDNANDQQANFNNQQISDRLFKNRSRKVLNFYGWSTDLNKDFISQEDGFHPSASTSAEMAKSFVNAFGNEINQLVLDAVDK